MKLVDANVLLYAINRTSPWYDDSRRWLTDALSGGEGVGFPWTTLLAVVRLSPSGTVFPPPLTAPQAMDVIDAWLASPVAVTVEPTERHATVLRSLLVGVGTAGNLTTDAHLAAMAIEHCAEVVTWDRDPARFGVSVVVPGLIL
jgi:toxin-antitoxin system PIN domain toxin